MKFSKILMISAVIAAAFAKKCIPAGPCYVGGCSGEVCSAEKGTSASICIWKPEFACYQDATCERQANGKCGWTQTDALEACIENAGNEDVPGPCFVGGCGGEVCSDEENVASICLWTPELACYKDATCERQDNGKCGWTETKALEKCIANAADEEPATPEPCFIGGCSNEICSAEEGVASICLWNPAFACYEDATCERQADGQCGWTETKTLKKCLAEAAEEEPTVPEPCYVGGCSNEICSEEEGASSVCIWSPEFACYGDATCERQADGQCGWTETKALKKCLANAGEETATA